MARSDAVTWVNAPQAVARDAGVTPNTENAGRMGAAFMHGLRPMLSEALGALTCCLLESSVGQPGSRSPPQQAVVARRERWWNSETPHSVRALESEAVLVRKCVAGGSPEGAGHQQPAPSVARAAGVQWGTDDDDRLPLLRVEVNGQDRHERLLATVVLQPCSMPTHPVERWLQVQTNPTYVGGAVTESEGLNIRWHSPLSEQSSQVFCVSAFGSLRHVPDCQAILQVLLTRHFPKVGLTGPWELLLEHSDRRVLDESGRVTPTSLDVFCRSESSAVCIESKFIVDAREGFGPCSQFPNNCAGHYGPGSDLKTGTAANCRLEVADGARGARSYFRKGRSKFQEVVFATQASGQVCPFRGPNFQLMRNVLFAASSGRVAWATLAIVPDRVGAVLRAQVSAFREQVLLPEYGDRLAVATYEDLIELLRESAFDESRKLGTFLAERIETVCGRQLHN